MMGKDTKPVGRIHLFFIIGCVFVSQETDGHLDVV